MKTKSLGILLAMVLALTVTITAQVPSMLNYQGRIAVNGVNFSGAGQFKFALINTNGSQSFWSNDGTSSAGSQPTAAVSIPVNSGIYNVRLGDTTLPNMTGVPATVFGNPDVHLRVWFNDGTNGWQQMSPDQRIAAVGYAMVANTVQDGAITSAKMANGAVGASQLAPGAVSAAMQAANLSAVAAGGIIGSNDPNSAALLAAGFVRDPVQLDSDARWTPLPSGDAVAGHTAVWTGTELLIWGGAVPVLSTGGAPGGNAYQAINRGVRYNPTTNTWVTISTSGAPQARFAHSAIWTGTEMIVFGGQTVTEGNPLQPLATGGRYNPSTDSWSSMAPATLTAGPIPLADIRHSHRALWTGTEMLVWGGSATTTTSFRQEGIYNNSLPGQRYDPATNTWSTMAMTPAELQTAFFTTSVWTGAEMIVWSSQQPGTMNPPQAGRYNPLTNSWQTLPRIPGDPPATPGFAHTAVWSGTEVILWGGESEPGIFSNGGYKFNPTTSTWSTTSMTGAPSVRVEHHAVWLGGEMIILGGVTYNPPLFSGVPVLDGGRYNPLTDSWQPVEANSSIARTLPRSQTATASGSKVVLWGGADGLLGPSYKFAKNAASYSPMTDSWTPVSIGSPSARFQHTAIWTGTEWIIWGGTVSSAVASDFDPVLGDGARYNPTTGVWTTLPAQNAPSARFAHSAAWTGNEMIIWGGQRFAAGMPENLDTGARYNPSTNSWSSIATTNAPSARRNHTAVWAGAPVNRMIIWGGQDSVPVASGSRYDPATDTWLSTSLTNAPMGANDHFSCWTGSEMIVFGAGNATDIASRYNPLTDSWQPMASPPSGLFGKVISVWTGSELQAVGAFGPGTPVFSAYSPVSNVWETRSSVGLPSNLSDSLYTSAVWAADRMILWGLDLGSMNVPRYRGYEFSPQAGQWLALETFLSPNRSISTGVWTGSELFLWGGAYDGFMMGYASDQGSRLLPSKTYYLYKRP